MIFFVALCAAVSRTSALSALSSNAKGVARAFREVCVSNPSGKPLGVSLVEFVSSCVDVLSAGYEVDLVELEMEADDDDDDEIPLTTTEREARRRWLCTVQYTLAALNRKRPPLTDVGDLELLAFVVSIVEGQLSSRKGVQLDRAIRKWFDEDHHTRRPAPCNVVPLSQIVLLTMRSHFANAADDAYPGATG